MARKKKAQPKAEEAKKEMAPAKKENVQKPEGKGPVSEKAKREAFRKYFVKLKRKLGIKPNLEEVIWMHLKATGNDQPEDFQKGIEHFGYKL